MKFECYFIQKDAILAQYILPILPCAVLIYSLSKSRSRSIKAVKKQKNKTEVDYFNLAMIPIRDIFALPSLSAQNYSHVYIQHPNTHPYPHLTDCISSSSPWPPEAKCRRSRDKCCPRDNIRIEMECYKYP